MTVMEPVMRFLFDYSRQTVDLDKVIAETNRPRKPVLRVMDRLAREGYLQEIADNGPTEHCFGGSGRFPRNPTWQIVKKPVYENPKSPKRRTVRDRMWQLIRARRRFNRVDLTRLTGASMSSATDYTNILERHGYIRQIGKDRQRKVYMLVKDCGPKRPILEEIANAK